MKPFCIIAGRFLSFRIPKETSIFINVIVVHVANEHTTGCKIEANKGRIEWEVPKESLFQHTTISP